MNGEECYVNDRTIKYLLKAIPTWDEPIMSITCKVKTEPKNHWLIHMVNGGLQALLKQYDLDMPIYTWSKSKITGKMIATADSMFTEASNSVIERKYQRLTKIIYIFRTFCILSQDLSSKKKNKESIGLQENEFNSESIVNENSYFEGFNPELWSSLRNFKDFIINNENTSDIKSVGLFTVYLNDTVIPDCFTGEHISETCLQRTQAWIRSALGQRIGNMISSTNRDLSNASLCLAYSLIHSSSNSTLALSMKGLGINALIDIAERLDFSLPILKLENQEEVDDIDIGIDLDTLGQFACSDMNTKDNTKYNISKSFKKNRSLDKNYKGNMITSEFETNINSGTILQDYHSSEINILKKINSNKNINYLYENNDLIFASTDKSHSKKASLKRPRTNDIEDTKRVITPNSIITKNKSNGITENISNKIQLIMIELILSGFIKSKSGKEALHGQTKILRKILELSTKCYQNLPSCDNKFINWFCEYSTRYYSAVLIEEKYSDISLNSSTGLLSLARHSIQKQGIEFSLKQCIEFTDNYVSQYVSNRSSLSEYLPISTETKQISKIPPLDIQMTLAILQQLKVNNNSKFLTYLDIHEEVDIPWLSGCIWLYPELSATLLRNEHHSKLLINSSRTKKYIELWNISISASIRTIQKQLDILNTNNFDCLSNSIDSDKMPENNIIPLNLRNNFLLLDKLVKSFSSLPVIGENCAIPISCVIRSATNDSQLLSMLLPYCVSVVRLELFRKEFLQEINRISSGNLEIWNFITNRYNIQLLSSANINSIFNITRLFYNTRIDLNLYFEDAIASSRYLAPIIITEEVNKNKFRNIYSNIQNIIKSISLDENIIDSNLYTNLTYFDNIVTRYSITDITDIFSNTESKSQVIYIHKRNIFNETPLAIDSCTDLLSLLCVELNCLLLELIQPNASILISKINEWKEFYEKQIKTDINIYNSKNSELINFITTQYWITCSITLLKKSVSRSISKNKTLVSILIKLVYSLNLKQAMAISIAGGSLLSYSGIARNSISSIILFASIRAYFPITKIDWLMNKVTEYQKLVISKAEKDINKPDSILLFDESSIDQSDNKSHNINKFSANFSLSYISNLVEKLNIISPDITDNIKYSQNYSDISYSTVKKNIENTKTISTMNYVKFENNKCENDLKRDQQIFSESLDYILLNKLDGKSKITNDEKDKYNIDIFKASNQEPSDYILETLFILYDKKIITLFTEKEELLITELTESIENVLINYYCLVKAILKYIKEMNIKTKINIIDDLNYNLSFYKLYFDQNILKKQYNDFKSKLTNSEDISKETNLIKLNQDIKINIKNQDTLDQTYLIEYFLDLPLLATKLNDADQRNLINSRYLQLIEENDNKFSFHSIVLQQYAYLVKGTNWRKSFKISSDRLYDITVNMKIFGGSISYIKNLSEIINKQRFNLLPSYNCSEDMIIESIEEKLCCFPGLITREILKSKLTPEHISPIVFDYWKSIESININSDKYVTDGIILTASVFSAIEKWKQVSGHINEPIVTAGLLCATGAIYHHDMEIRVLGKAILTCIKSSVDDVMNKSNRVAKETLLCIEVIRDLELENSQENSYYCKNENLLMFSKKNINSVTQFNITIVNHIIKSIRNRTVLYESMIDNIKTPIRSEELLVRILYNSDGGHSYTGNLIFCNIIEELLDWDSVAIQSKLSIINFWDKIVLLIQSHFTPRPISQRLYKLIQRTIQLLEREDKIYAKQFVRYLGLKTRILEFLPNNILKNTEIYDLIQNSKKNYIRF